MMHRLSATALAMLALSVGALGAQAPAPVPQGSGRGAGKLSAASTRPQSPPCETAKALPTYTAPAAPPADGKNDGKADNIDGSVTARPAPSASALKGAEASALRLIETLTRSDAQWKSGYLAAERQSPIGRTVEGRVFLRLDAIEKILQSQQP